MKTILVPTDFSACAKNAADYASELNKKVKAKLLLFHTSTINFEAGQAFMPESGFDDIERNQLNKLNAESAGITKKNPGMPIDIGFRFGFLAEVIQNEVQQTHSGLIVMGTQGAGALKEFLVGSNTADVMERSPVPVLAVPMGATFHGMKTIAYALDFDVDHTNEVQQIISIARYFNSEILLLHFSVPENEALDEIKLAGFADRIRKVGNYLNIRHKQIFGLNVLEGITHFSKNNDLDLLVISMRHRSFFEKLFSSSLTKKLAYKSSIPVLALHSPVKNP